MTACCCASPDCRVNGCSIQRGLQQPAPQMWPPTGCNPPPAGYATGVPMPMISLTAEDVRRIVREELAQNAEARYMMDALAITYEGNDQFAVEINGMALARVSTMSHDPTEMLLATIAEALLVLRGGEVCR